MQLFNNSKRTFTVSKVVTKEDKATEQVVEPQQLFEVSDKDGAKLLELYPDEIIEPIAIQKPVDTTDLDAKIEELGQEVVKLTEDLNKSEDAVEDLKQQLIDLQAKLDTAEQAKEDAETNVTALQAKLDKATK